jgi:hypothetical protein
MLVILASCVSGAPPAGPATPTFATITRCPLGVPGTRIRIADNAAGIDVFFVTSDAERVEELRARVRSQVERHGPDEHAGLGHHGSWHRMGHDHGMRLWSMPPMRVEAFDIDGGARLAIAPVDPARRDELRAEVIRRVAKIEAAGCRE